MRISIWHNSGSFPTVRGSRLKPPIPRASAFRGIQRLEIGRSDLGISQVLANGENRALAGSAAETNFFVEADGRFWRPADYVLNSTQACRHPQRHVLGSRTRMLRHVGSTPLLTTEAERCPAFHADRDSPRDQPCLAP